MCDVIYTIRVPESDKAQVFNANLKFLISELLSLSKSGPSAADLDLRSS